jgi:hypothetical protein
MRKPASSGHQNDVAMAPALKFFDETSRYRMFFFRLITVMTFLPSYSILDRCSSSGTYISEMRTHSAYAVLTPPSMTLLKNYLSIILWTWLESFGQFF